MLAIHAALTLALLPSPQVDRVPVERSASHERRPARKADEPEEREWTAEEREAWRLAQIRERLDPWTLDSIARSVAWMTSPSAVPEVQPDEPFGTRVLRLGVSQHAWLVLGWLGTGDTMNTGEVRKRIRTSIGILRKLQSPENGRLGNASLLEHCEATLALSRAQYTSPNPLLKRATQKALNWIWNARADEELGTVDERTLRWALTVDASAARARLRTGSPSVREVENWCLRQLGLPERPVDPAELAQPRGALLSLLRQDSRVPGDDDVAVAIDWLLSRRVAIGVDDEERIEFDWTFLDLHLEELVGRLGPWPPRDLRTLERWQFIANADNAIHEAGAPDWRRPQFGWDRFPELGQFLPGTFDAGAWSAPDVPLDTLALTSRMTALLGSPLRIPVRPAPGDRSSYRCGLGCGFDRPKTDAARRQR